MGVLLLCAVIELHLVVTFIHRRRLDKLVAIEYLLRQNSSEMKTVEQVSQSFIAEPVRLNTGTCEVQFTSLCQLR